MVGIGDLYDDFKALCKQWFYEKSEVNTALNSKQATLVSGTNIKTINNESILGSGNINVNGGGGITIDDVYPVGSIYMSVTATSPQTLFGGTWQQLTDTFLYASATADTNSTTATAGESTHSLTSSEMPRHTHTQNSHNHTQNSHYHGCGDSRAFVTQKSSYTGDVGEKSIKQGTSGTAFTTVAFNSNDNWYGTENTSGATATNQSQTATNKYTGGTGTSESASNGSAHNNMPPYMKVYMWKRTA